MKKSWIAVFVGVCLLVGIVAGYFVHAQLRTKGKPEETREQAATQHQGSSPEPEKRERSYSNPLPFDELAARHVVWHLSSTIGTRVQGTEKENEAAGYLESELRKLDYDQVTRQSFSLPDGRPSQNIICSDPGESADYIFIIGAHIDSVATTPGANDNASGCATVLQLARCLKNTRHLPELRFIFFGAEEYYDKSVPVSERIDHQGSRHYAYNLSAEEKVKVVGMISIDMVAVGEEVHFRAWGGPNSSRLAESLFMAGCQAGFNGRLNPSKISDHEPFGTAGMPAAWVERIPPGQKYDPMVHKPGDNLEHVDTELLAQVGRFLIGYLLNLDHSECEHILMGTREQDVNSTREGLPVGLAKSTPLAR